MDFILVEFSESTELMDSDNSQYLDSSSESDDSQYLSSSSESD